MNTILEEKKMDNHVLLSVKKRKEKLIDFYYKVYGQIIKKRRLELNYTQEYLAAAICSNTYISKAENNQVVIGDDQLMRIMERLEISPNQFAKPETLFYYIEKIIQYFYYGDLEAYERLMKKVEGYDFHAVIELIKMGYYILNKEYKKAIDIYHLSLNYLSSLDDLAFQVFLVFASQATYRLKQFSLSKSLIESSILVNHSNCMLSSLIDYCKFMVYSKLHYHRQATILFSKLMIELGDMGNIDLINDVVMMNAINKEYANEGTNLSGYNHLFAMVDSDMVNEYLLLKSINEDNPKYYISKMESKDNMSYMIGLYLMAKQALKHKRMDDYQQINQEISELHYKVKSKIDFNYLLDLEKKQDLVKLKEYLVNPCLKEAINKQDIYIMKKTTERIVDILQSRSRYKDGLNYSLKLETDIDKIRRT
jgi:transcriptional regulator with XRE-family HTH domain